MVKDESINILVADNSENSSEAVLSMLEKKGYSIKSQRVSKKAELSEALNKQQWDILLLNDELTDFSPMECVEWLKRKSSHAALLLLTGKEIDINSQVEAYNSGIAGVISLQSPEFLQTVFSRELDTVKLGQQSSQLEKDNQELVERCRLLLSSSREAVTYIHQGMHIYANDSYIQKFGFKDRDEVSGMPFIDLIDGKSRDKLKECLKQVENQWEEGQEKEQISVDIVASKVDGKAFKAQLLLEPTLFEGEKCLQVFVSTEKENQKKLDQAVRLDFESGLFNRQFFLQQFDLLLQSIADGKVPGGKLLYIRLNLNDQIRSRLGFEKADSELKKFTSMLKQKMSKSVVVARFGDADFIIMIAGDIQKPELKKDIESWQKQFQDYRFTDLGDQDNAAPGCHLISQEIDKNTRNIKDVLTTVYQELNELQVDEKPKSTSRRDRISAARSKSLSEMGSIKIELADKVVNSVDSIPQLKPEQIVDGKSLEKSSAREAKSSDITLDDAEAGSQVELNADDLTQIINNGKIKLSYEAVIAVADIEPEFNEVAVMLDDQRYAHIPSADLYRLLDTHPLGTKFDRQVLELTLQVMVDLHKQGQSQLFGVTLSSNSLKDDRLVPWLNEQLKKNKLDPSALIIHVQQETALRDVSVCVGFFSTLKESGMKSCISHFKYCDGVNNIVKKRKPDYIKLSEEISSCIASNEEQKAEIEELTELFHDENIKVIAGQVDDSGTLSAYWVCNVDLVQGKYFQKNFIELNTANIAENNSAGLVKTA